MSQGLCRFSAPLLLRPPLRRCRQIRALARWGVAFGRARRHQAWRARAADPFGRCHRCRLRGAEPADPGNADQCRPALEPLPARAAYRPGSSASARHANEFDMLNLVHQGTRDEKVYQVLSQRMQNRYDLFGSLPDTIEDVDRGHRATRREAGAVHHRSAQGQCVRLTLRLNRAARRAGLGSLRTSISSSRHCGEAFRRMVTVG